MELPKLLEAVVGDQINNPTGRNGYPTFSSNVGNSTSNTATGTAGYNKEAIVIYDDTDGEEFLALAIKTGSGNSYDVGLTICKDTEGYWMFLQDLGGFAYDPLLGYWTGTSGPGRTSPSTQYDTDLFMPLRLVATQAPATSTPGYTNEYTGVWFPANDRIYASIGSNNRFGYYLDIGENGTEHLISMSYSGQAIRIPVV